MIAPLRILAVCSWLAVTATAQSPLRTIQPFAADNGGSSGGIIYFDLQVRAGIILTSIDANYGATIGLPVGILMYTAPTTHVGNETTSGAWTLVGQDDGTTTSAGRNGVTTFTFQQPVLLAPGSYGVAFVAVNSAHAYTNGTGTNQSWQTAELRLQAGAAQNVPWSGAPLTPRVMNCGLHYVPSQGYAQAIRFGDACGAGDQASFYELFDTTRPNDLSGHAGLTLLWTGGSYVVLPRAAPIVPPSGGNLNLTDDQTVAVPLPWPLPSAAGSSSSIWVCSNGWASLEATTNTTYLESVSELLGGPTRIAAWFDDLNPSAGGAVHAEVDPQNPGIFHVTWWQVPEYSNTGANTMQLSFQPSGVIEMKWGALTAADGIVGYSPGHSARDFGSVDVSLLTTPMVLGDEHPALELVGAARPVLGTTASIQTRHIRSNSSSGAVLWGLSQVPAPGFDLGVIGMPGCLQHVVIAIATALPVTSTSATSSLPVPNLPSLVGQSLYMQSIVFTPGINPFGAATSNGLEWRFDTQ